MITFVFPMILFIAVAAALYVVYTKSALVPGHRDSRAERPVSHTFQPGEPATAATGELQAGSTTAAEAVE